MAIYLNTFHDFCNPLSFCDKIIPNTILWQGLKITHSLWWFNTRKRLITEEKSPLELALQAVLQPLIFTNCLTLPVAQFLLAIVKVEETFTAFSHAQNAWNSTHYTWKGDYCRGKPSVHKRIIPVAKKIFEYLSSLFCLTMTFVDVVDTCSFSDKSKFEATLFLPDNAAKVLSYLKQSPEAIRKKLYGGRPLVGMVTKKIKPDLSPEDLIDDMSESLQRYHSIKKTISKYVNPLCRIIQWIYDLFNAKLRDQINYESPEFVRGYNSRFYTERVKGPLGHSKRSTVPDFW